MSDTESTQPVDPNEPTASTPTGSDAPTESSAVTPPEQIPTATAAPAFTKPPRRKVGLVAVIAGASVLAIGSAAGGVAAGVQFARYSATQTTSSSTTTTLPQSGGSTTGGSNGGLTFGNGGYSSNGGTTQGGTSNGTSGGTSDGTSDGTTSGSSTATTATDAQEKGIVLINTELKYLGGEAAGTGIVLSSTGEILTNNHVVEGSTSISVTIASTGKTYTAKVVGTDSTDDIAVLQLENASGLTTADLDTSSTVAEGDAVTGVGNAEGQGYLSAAAGTVTALDQKISVADEVTGASKTLSGLIETNADIVSGDSGGPLLDSDGEVVGIDTAASSDDQNPTGYSIPIASALKIVDQIESGTESSNVSLGYPAFLGVELATDSATTTEGAAISGTIDGTPAATAGLVAGDTITAVDGTTVADGDALSAAIAKYDIGDSVKLTYVTASGTSHTVTVTLIQGAAK